MKKYILIFFLGGLVTLAVAAYFVFQMQTFGGTFDGARLTRMKQSPQYKNGRFENTPPQDTSMNLIAELENYMGGQVREPIFEVPVTKMTLAGVPPKNEMSAYWIGHSGVLVEIGGARILTDPVFSEYAAPFQFPPMPKRLHSLPIHLEHLPKIDAVVISHDHYDHLDMKTVKYLAGKGTSFFVGLGIGAHLERWGVPAAQIHEMDWWDTRQFRGLTIHCTPTRHYSGRKKMDNSTLWASWYVKSPSHSFYYSGDTGYGPHFAAAAEKLGPPSLSIIKVGAYGSTWLDIHMDPESAVQAHADLKAQTMLPVHWATFNLAYHDWDEPILRTVAAASKKGAHLITPMPGEKFTFGQTFESKKWYEPQGGSLKEAPPQAAASSPETLPSPEVPATPESAPERTAEPAAPAAESTSAPTPAAETPSENDDTEE